MGELQPIQLQILQQALGLDEFGRGASERDYFVTGPDQSDFAVCDSLVSLGLMVNCGAREWLGGDTTFRVTNEGRRACRVASPHPPKPSRSKLRYQRYLRLSDTFSDLTFNEFLKNEECFRV